MHFVLVWPEIIFNLAVFIFHPTVAQTTEMGCIKFPYFSRCYTVHNSTATNQENAAAECHQHNDGRLATIIESKLQQLLAILLDSSSQSILFDADYWIGATFRILNQWTWLNGATYANEIPFSSAVSSGGSYACVRKELSSDGSWQLKLASIPFSGKYMNGRTTSALCKGCTSAAYCTVIALSWFNGRQKCLEAGGDLAVLTRDEHSRDRDVINSLLQENTDYFIGLSKVRLIWHTARGEIDARYNNWMDTAPRSENELCVTLWPPGGVWNVADCSRSKPFICEYDVYNITTTSLRSSTPVATSTTPVTTTMSRSRDSKSRESTHETITQMAEGFNFVPVVGVFATLSVLSIACIVIIICHVRHNYVRRILPVAAIYESVNLSNIAPPALYEPIRNPAEL